jgi:hypothetical protein
MGDNNIVYLRSKDDEDCIYSLGIHFKEFIKAVGEPINLLLLEHKYSSEDYSYNADFDYVLFENLEELLKENVYSYGDFSVKIKTLE